jgi:hypothetical protein
VPFCGKVSGSSEIGSGRAVSRFLSALLRVERIICLSSRYPKPVCFRKRGTSRSSVSYLALHPMGFSVPRRLRFARWALTPPFHPYPNCLRNSGGIFSVALSVGTTHVVAARVYLQLNWSYAASCSAVFGLSSRDLCRERFSALPEPHLNYVTSSFPTSERLLRTNSRKTTHGMKIEFMSPGTRPSSQGPRPGRFEISIVLPLPARHAKWVTLCKV